MAVLIEADQIMSRGEQILTSSQILLTSLEQSEFVVIRIVW